MSIRSWGVSIALGFGSLPIGFLIRCIPNEPAEKLFIKLRIMDDPSVFPTTAPKSRQQNEAIDTVRKSRYQRLQEAGARLPSFLKMVFSFVMTIVGAGF
ncbi:hypothetical protein FRC02_005771 [Tulasnella sp. 418]|nr:hypothetical protein FRC02_005771 [Tulasnella sp. 418]